MVKALTPLAAAVVLILGTLVLITDCEESETVMTEEPLGTLSETQEDFLSSYAPELRDTEAEREELLEVFDDINQSQDDWWKMRAEADSDPEMVKETRIESYGLPVAVFKRLDLMDLPGIVLRELSRISHTCEARIGELDTQDMGSYDERVFQVQLEAARKKDICVSQFTHLEAPFASRLNELDRMPQ